MGGGEEEELGPCEEPRDDTYRGSRGWHRLIATFVEVRDRRIEAHQTNRAALASWLNRM